MKSYLFFIIALLSLSCADDTTINDPNLDLSKSSYSKVGDTLSVKVLTSAVIQTSESGPRIMIQQDIIKFLNGNNHFGDIYINPATSRVNVSCGFDFQSSATFNSGIKSNNYYSSKNSVGKTYTEEFEDKQGNLRTRVYENGLLVSYKINGVEQ